MLKAAGHQSRSPLYAQLASMIGTFLRIDLPVLGFVDEFVLYTDVDVLFVQDVTLDDFSPLPKYYTVGTEASGNSSHIDSKVPITGDGHFRSVTDALTNAEMSWRPPPSSVRSIGYGNAGIMLINVPWMRRTYDEFVAWTFSGANVARGLHFGPFGPGDQGAYNQFYTGKFNVHRWPLFNWKPYWGYNPRAKLVHFHGPKPDDYIVYRVTGQVTHKALTTLLRRCREGRASSSPASSAAQNLNDIHGWGCYRYTEVYLKWRRVVEKNLTMPDWE